MAKQDLRINEFDVGVDELFSGAWIVVEWNDVGRTVCLLKSVARHNRTYRGPRNIEVWVRDEADAWRMSTNVQHDSIVAVLGSLDNLSYAEAAKRAAPYLK